MLPRRGRERPSAARRSGRQTGSRVNGLVWFWSGSASLVLSTSAAVSEAAKPGGPFPRSVVGNPEFSPKVRGSVCSFCWISFSLAFSTLFGFSCTTKPRWSNSLLRLLQLGVARTQPGKAHLLAARHGQPRARGPQRQGDLGGLCSVCPH